MVETVTRLKEREPCIHLMWLKEQPAQVMGCRIAEWLGGCGAKTKVDRYCPASSNGSAGSTFQWCLSKTGFYEQDRRFLKLFSGTLQKLAVSLEKQRRQTQTSHSIHRHTHKDSQLLFSLTHTSAEAL